MIHSLCHACFQPYRLMVSPEEIQLLRQISENDGHTAKCPRLCGGSINILGDPSIDNLVEKAQLKEPLSITGTELYRAVNGMGLADELPKNIESLEAILSKNKVTKADIEVTEDGHFYLHELHLENGLIVHLTSGLKGAEVLKITRGISNAS